MPWHLAAMLRENVRVVYRGADITRIDRPSKLIPAVIVTYSRIPPCIILVLCLVAWLFGYTRLIYRLVQMHIYIPAFADATTFPLVFDPEISYRFKTLTSRNMEAVLYSSCRIPLISTSNGNSFDGAFVFYYMNGRPRPGAEVTLLSDTAKPTRSIIDQRPCAVCTVRVSLSTNTLLEWFHPWYAIHPAARRRKWLLKAHTGPDVAAAEALPDSSPLALEYRW